MRKMVTAHTLSQMKNVVIDTNVLVSALMSERGAAREVVRRCLQRKVQPLVDNALFAEYEDVFSRESLFERTSVSQEERQTVLDAFLNRCRWVQISWLWRPHLPDEADNHPVELAIGGNAECIVTGNLKDFRGAELRFDKIDVLSPADFLNEDR